MASPGWTLSHIEVAPRFGAGVTGLLAAAYVAAGLLFLALPDDQGLKAGRGLLISLGEQSGAYLAFRWALALTGILGVLAMPFVTALIAAGGVRIVALTFGILGYAVLALSNVRIASDLGWLADQYGQLDAARQDILVAVTISLDLDPAGIVSFGLTGVAIALVGAGLWSSASTRVGRAASALGILGGLTVMMAEPIEILAPDSEESVQYVSAVSAVTLIPGFFVCAAVLILSTRRGQND